MDERRKILEMLAKGRITAEEADRLIEALGPRSAGGRAEPPPGQGRGLGPGPRHLHVVIEREQDGGARQVDVRVPIALVRAGVRFTRLIPDEARQRANAALRQKGLDFDLDDLNPKNLDEMIAHLGDLQVDLHDKGARVRVFAD